jgi:hypothetical protein
MTFSDDYGHLLSPFLKEYKKANNEKARKAVIKNAADAISSSSALLEDKGTSLPKNLKTVCLFINLFLWHFDVIPPFFENFISKGRISLYGWADYGKINRGRCR